MFCTSFANGCRHCNLMNCYWCQTGDVSYDYFPSYRGDNCLCRKQSGTTTMTALTTHGRLLGLASRANTAINNLKCFLRESSQWWPPSCHQAPGSHHLFKKLSATRRDWWFSWWVRPTTSQHHWHTEGVGCEYMHGEGGCGTGNPPNLYMVVDMQSQNV